MAQALRLPCHLTGTAHLLQNSSAGGRIHDERHLVLAMNDGESAGSWRGAGPGQRQEFRPASTEQGTGSTDWLIIAFGELCVAQ